MKNAIRKMVMIAEKAVIRVSSLLTQTNWNFKPTEGHISGELEFDDYNTEKNEIKLNDFQGQNFMITIQDSLSYCSKFSETWDFQLFDEKTVRFQESECYQSANNGVLWIYTKQKVEAASHCEDGQTITTYFLAGLEVEIEAFLN
ncbi:hypothetical protein [Aquipluma nitroreducens]|nr:hypothetical protein [Aquipluma nitroreducens]